MIFHLHPTPIQQMLLTKWLQLDIRPIFSQPFAHSFSFIPIWCTHKKYANSLRLFQTWESAPEETRTFKLLENARPVILFWWPFNFVLTCRKNDDTDFEKMYSSCLCGIIKLSVEYQYNLINPNIIYLDRRVFHAYGNDIVVLRMKCQKSYCWRWGHESCHSLQPCKQI